MAQWKGQVIGCQRPKLQKRLKANHNFVFEKDVDRAVVKDLSYRKD